MMIEIILDEITFGHIKWIDKWKQIKDEGYGREKDWFSDLDR
jgi:hypothetical protein